METLFARVDSKAHCHFSWTHLALTLVCTQAQVANRMENLKRKGKSGGIMVNPAMENGGLGRSVEDKNKGKGGMRVVPRSDKQASQVVASEEVNVETEAVCVNEEEDVNLNEEERVVAERRELSVEISSVPAAVEEKPVLVEGSGGVESQVSLEVESQTASEEECDTMESELFVEAEEHGPDTDRCRLGQQLG
ncbi:hypothetical protein V6N13_120245 [Hibiscus sabdariffa]